MSKPEIPPRLKTLLGRAEKVLLEHYSKNPVLVIGTREDIKEAMPKYLKQGYLPKDVFKQHRELIIEVHMLQEIVRESQKEIRELKEDTEGIWEHYEWMQKEPQRKSYARSLEDYKRQFEERTKRNEQEIARERKRLQEARRELRPLLEQLEAVKREVLEQWRSAEAEEG